MEETAAPEIINEEDKANPKENVKDFDGSPELTSIKSSKNANTSKIKYPVKSNVKNQSSFAKSASQKGPCFPSQNKTVSKLAMSTNSSTASSPSSKTRIPSSISKTAFSSSKNSVNLHQKPPVKQNTPRKNVPQREVSVKKPQEIKEKQIKRSNSKEAKQPTSSSSKFNFVKQNTPAVQSKSDFKSKSARSSSVSGASEREPSSSRNKRSPSNISLRSNPCCYPENETILRKTISTAGDVVSSTKKVEKDNNQDPTEMLTNNQKEFIASENSNEDLKCEMKNYLEQWFLSSKNDLKNGDQINACKVEELQLLKSNNILSFIDDFCATYKECNTEQLKGELKEGNESVLNLEKKYKDLLQKHEDLIKLKSDLTEAAELKIAKKDEYIKEFQKTSKMQETQFNQFKTTIHNLEKEKASIQTEKDNLQADLKTCKECLSTSNKKQQDSEEQLKQERREAIKNIENALIFQQKLETDLAEMTTKLELQTKTNEKTQMEHEEQLRKMSETISYLETEKEDLKKQNEKLELEILEMAKVKEKLLNSENKLQELQIELDKKQKLLEKVPAFSKEDQLELAKLRQSEGEKHREIEKLKLELSTTKLSIFQLEQQIQRDQQLLNIRSSLINSLQNNEKSHQIHIEDLFAQVGEKNNTINELNCELQTKTEEFRNLCTNLSSKQMEVANQEHIIKLLEESNERSQMLRVKQEEKVGRLEMELAHLKQSITFYQANVLAANSGGHLMCNPPPNVNYNENFYYYISERKRKRQIDINVKKYET